MSFKVYEEKLKELKERQVQELTSLEEERDAAFKAYKVKLNRLISEFFDEDIEIEYNSDGLITGYNGFCLVVSCEDDYPEWGKAQDDNFATYLYDRGVTHYENRPEVPAYNFVGFLGDQKDWPLDFEFKDTIFKREGEWRQNFYSFRSIHEAQFYHFSRGAIVAEVSEQTEDSFVIYARGENIDKRFTYKRERSGMFEEYD